MSNTKFGIVLPDDLTGFVFGLWTVIEKGVRMNNQRGAAGNYWLCEDKKSKRKEITRRSLTKMLK